MSTKRARDTYCVLADDCRVRVRPYPKGGIGAHLTIRHPRFGGQVMKYERFERLIRLSAHSVCVYLEHESLACNPLTVLWDSRRQNPITAPMVYDQDLTYPRLAPHPLFVRLIEPSGRIVPYPLQDPFGDPLHSEAQSAIWTKADSGAAIKGKGVYYLVAHGTHAYYEPAE